MDISYNELKNKEIINIGKQKCNKETPDANKASNSFVAYILLSVYEVENKIATGIAYHTVFGT